MLIGTGFDSNKHVQKPLGDSLKRNIVFEFRVRFREKFLLLERKKNLVRSNRPKIKLLPKRSTVESNLFWSRIWTHLINLLKHVSFFEIVRDTLLRPYHRHIKLIQQLHIMYYRIFVGWRHDQGTGRVSQIEMDKSKLAPTDIIFDSFMDIMCSL